jgi:hypothetical protein
VSRRHSAVAWLPDRQRHSDHSGQQPDRLFRSDHIVWAGRPENCRSSDDVYRARKAATFSPDGMNVHPPLRGTSPGGRMGKSRQTMSPIPRLVETRAEGEEIGGCSRNHYGMAAIAALAHDCRRTTGDCWPNWPCGETEATSAGSGRSSHRAKFRAATAAAAAAGSSGFPATKEPSLTLSTEAR